MNWEAIGAIGEVVGAAGVIATLIYLAVQIRQNSRLVEQNSLSIQAQAKQVTMQLGSTFMQSLLGSPELRRALRRVEVEGCNLESLTEDERDLLEVYWIRGLMHFSDDHFRYVSGLLSDEEWQEQLNILEHGYAVVEAFRIWWFGGGKRFYGPRFVTFLDHQLKKAVK